MLEYSKIVFNIQFSRIKVKGKYPLRREIPFEGKFAVFYKIAVVFVLSKHFFSYFFTINTTF